MKKVLFLFLFSLLFIVFNTSIFGQIAEKTPVPAETGVEDIYLAKDDGSGQTGDIAETFSTTDIPIHCIVTLNPGSAAVVKMNFIAVNVKGVKPEFKVLSISYKTDGKQNQVNFTGKPDKVWTAGNYRVDIFLDGKPAGNRTFEIQKSPGEIEKNILPAVKSFVAPAKPAPKTRPARRPPKN